MKKTIILVAVIAAAFTQALSAQSYGFRVKAGVNIGGTSPLPIPAEIRKIKSYSPGMNFSIGGDVIKYFNKNWGFLTGLRFESKGMSTHANVKSYKMAIDISEGAESGRAEGYFTGDVKATVKNEYITIPLECVWNVSPRWEVNGGIFFSMLIKGEFNGAAKDGYIRDRTPVGEKIGVTTATYNLSKDIRKFNWGLGLGAHWKAYKQFSLYGDFTMAANSIFRPDFETISFDMYNIYMNLGFAYTF